MKIRTLAVILSLAALAGCAGGGYSSSSSGSSHGAAEQACLRDVRNMTNNPQVVVIASNPHQAGGKYVTVGVGPDRAPWQCIGYEDGATAEIMSLVDEGRM